MTSWSAHILAHFDEFKLDVTIDGDDRPLAIVGANGSGKTTFLRTLTGAVPTEQSEIVVGDVVLASNERHVDLPIEQRRIGYVPQGYGLFPHLDALDNVAFGVPGSRSERRERARAILHELDCAALADRVVTTLSGGEQQRVALARALVVEPRLILLDEPLAALDATSRRTVREFLADRLRTLSCPSVIVTHDVRDVIALDALVVVFDAGRVTQRGTIADLREAPSSDFVTEFVGTC